MEQKNLLVTIADKNYLQQTKQFFSGAYFNAGWDGDYMLLTSNDVPEEKLEWFKNRGIIVNKKKLLFEDKVGGMNPIVAHKIYLFTPEFKKWNIVLYIDTDTIIRKSLEILETTKRFSAVRDCYFFKIKNEIINKEDRVKRGISREGFISKFKTIKKDDLGKPAFNTGVFSFNTEIIEKNQLMEKLKYLISEYNEISKWGEQLAFNLAFPDWKKISPIYNFFIIENKNKAELGNNDIKATILHLTAKIKPWDQKNDFYKEWLYNFKRAEDINVDQKIKVKKISKEWEFFYSAYLNLRFFLFDIPRFLDEKIGQIGLIKNNIAKNLPFS